MLFVLVIVVASLDNLNYKSYTNRNFFQSIINYIIDSDFSSFYDIIECINM